MKKSFSLFLLGLLLFACNNDDNSDDITTDDNPIATTDDVEVQSFMWQAMNLWYFWQQDVPDLADNRFSSDPEFTAFLAETPDPNDLMERLLFNEDRFTFWNEDYTTLVNNLSGISKSNGLEFGLARYGDGNAIFGYVRYTVIGSDAEAKPIRRGNLFTRVDGILLNDVNYIDLLFGDNDTYTLGLARIENNTIVETGSEVTLTKQENLVENPILLSKTLDVNGIKVGYLVYNGFTNEFDSQLNDVFGQFVADGVTELILDFRYNPGGSVNSSRLLSSMVYGTNTNDLYIRQRWNDKLMQIFDPENLEDYFANTVEGAPLNTLNLSKVYVLTTGRTASASELVINGLTPYVDVIQIGGVTSGKNEFSITMVDDPDREGAPFIYTPSRENQINPNNSWALQPLVGRNENAAGFSDYTSGLVPDIPLEEDLADLGTLGEPDEPLLARALQEISGSISKQSFEVLMPAKPFTDSKMFTPLKDNMYLDKDIKVNFNK